MYPYRKVLPNGAYNQCHHYVLQQLGCEGLETALRFYPSWDVSCVTPWQWDLFVGHHLGLNQLLLISTDRGLDCFLITVSFQQLSWLSMPFCASLSSSVQYFFPVSFHIITHNLISELIFVCFFVCMAYLGCYQHLVNISCQ